MKTLAKLNANGFQVQEILEGGFSYNTLVCDGYKVQVGSNKGYIVESVVPPTFAGNDLYKIFFPLTSNLKGVDNFNYGSGIPLQGGIYPLYTPNKENITVGQTDLKSAGVKNAGIFNIEGALSYERLTKENLISVPNDFSNWRSYFYKVNPTETIQIEDDTEDKTYSDSFQSKSPLGTYDTAIFDASSFDSTKSRLVWVIPVKSSNLLSLGENPFCFSFYLNKNFTYIKTTDIRLVSTDTQIVDKDSFNAVFSNFESEGIESITDTREYFTTANNNSFYKLPNNEWQRFAVAFEVNLEEDNNVEPYNYIMVRFTPGLQTNDNQTTINTDLKLQVCAPMFERGYLPSPYGVIREKKNTNNAAQISYKYPLLFDFSKKSTNDTTDVLDMNTKWLISYKRKFESTLTTQTNFKDSLGSVVWGYSSNNSIFCNQSAHHIESDNFDIKDALNKWETVFIYPTSGKLCIEVHLENGKSYKIVVSENFETSGTFLNNILYHLHLGGVIESNSTLKKFNGYYKDLMYISGDNLDIEKCIKELLTNKLALHSKEVWDNVTNSTTKATILQTESLKEGF